MFTVLQNGGHDSFNLNEALVQIRNDDRCYAWGFDVFTPNMICAGSYSGFNGPCFVRSL